MCVCVCMCMCVCGVCVCVCVCVYTHIQQCTHEIIVVEIKKCQLIYFTSHEHAREMPLKVRTYHTEFVILL